MIFKKKNIGINYYRMLLNRGTYSDKTKIKNMKKENILKYFKITKRRFNENDNVLIESKYDDLIFPMFDLDSEDKKDLFKTIYKDTPYCLFRTSPNHYWAFLDKPVKNFNELYDTNWLVCNDPEFVRLSKSWKKMMIRGLYKSSHRKPKLIYKNLNFSDKFSKFMNGLTSWYTNEGLELSCLIHKNHDLLLIFNRKKKLENLNKKLKY